MESDELKLVCPGGNLYLSIHLESAMDRKRDADSAESGTDGNGRPVEGRGEVWACHRPVQRETQQGPSLPERRGPFLVLRRAGD